MRRLVIALCFCFSVVAVNAALKDESYSDAKVSFKVANHMSASIQAKIFHNGMHFRDVYIAPYYAVDLIDAPEGLFTLELYDISDSFIGYIEETRARDSYDNGSTLISISRFGIKPSVTTKLNYPDVTDLAERMDLSMLAAEAARKPNPVESPKPAKLAEPAVMRRLKLANLSSYLLYIEISAENGSALVGPRFIAYDAYSPELVKEADNILLFAPADTISIKAFKLNEAAARECLAATSCDQVLKTYSVKLSELRIDDNDNYIWIIDELP